MKKSKGNQLGSPQGQNTLQMVIIKMLGEAPTQNELPHTATAEGKRAGGTMSN